MSDLKVSACVGDAWGSLAVEAAAVTLGQAPAEAQHCTGTGALPFSLRAPQRSTALWPS